MDSEILIAASLVDTLRYRLYAQTSVAQERVRISVAVHALVEAEHAEESELQARIHAALQRFIVAEWSLSSISRETDECGLERIGLTASTRVLPAENYRLDARARSASHEGLVLKEPQADYALAPEEVSATVQALRERTIQEVQTHIENFNKSTGRVWRIGEIEFGVDSNVAFPDRRTGKRAYASDDLRGMPAAGSEAAVGLSGTERIVLVTQVVLKASLPILH